MTTKEMLIALIEGKKIIHSYESEGSFIFMHENGIIYDNNGEPIFQLYVHARNDWELYQEPEEEEEDNNRKDE